MKKVIIIMLLGIAAVAAGILVFLCLSPRIDYASARPLTTEILGTRGAVEKMLDADEVTGELDEAQRGIVRDFKAALETTDKDMAELAKSNSLEDKEAAARFEAAKAEYKKIEKVGRIWADVERFEKLSDENIEALKKSESAAIKEIAEGLADLRAKAKVYHEKYDGGGKGSNALIEDYSGVWLDAAALEEKAKKLSLDDILGMSRDDILEFYAKMKELNSYISEK